jgi:uncharacterized protein (DUF362 family)
MLRRRQLLTGSVAASLSPFVAACSRSAAWDRAAYRKTARSRVAVLGARSYDASLAETVRRGLELFPLTVRGKAVVLKPNLVEFDPSGAVNTHPALIAAAIEAFRGLGAREVIVAEGPGHRRDNEYLLTASGVYQMLREHRVGYADLNRDTVRLLRLRSRFTELRQLYFPETVLGADLLVSLPKLKTHHWAGVTLSLKNMFGIVPGGVYGWPKNVLHWAGIGGSILDINSTLPVPHFAIVDGVVGMEGNGPIQGEPKHAGVLILGEDLVAVDATAARLMAIDPGRIDYLAQADAFLGNLREEHIVQIGERPEGFQSDFRLVDSLRHLKAAPARRRARETV